MNSRSYRRQREMLSVTVHNREGDSCGLSYQGFQTGMSPISPAWILVLLCLLTASTTANITANTSTANITLANNTRPLNCTDNICTSVDKRVDDPFDLLEWERKPELFGTSFFGVMGNYPKERATVQKLLNAVKNRKGDNSSLDLTIMLARGYFNGIPDILDGPETSGFGATFLRAVQDDLESKVLANAQTYMKMNETDQTNFLMKNVLWRKVLVNAALRQENAQNIVIGPLTEKAFGGSVVALWQYLDTPQGSEYGGGVAKILENEFDELVNISNNSTDPSKRYDNMSDTDQVKYLITNFRVQKVIITLLILRRYEEYQPKDVSDQCYTDAVHMLRNMLKGETWALEMFDAAGKLPIGLFQGNLNWIGQYDQCNLLVANRTDIQTGKLLEMNAFQGSYCDIKMPIPESLKIPTAPGQKLYLRMGVCFPSTCNSPEVRSIMQNLDVLGYKLPPIESARCHGDSPMNKGTFRTDGLAHAAAGIMGFIALLIVMCTIIEGALWYNGDSDGVMAKEKRSEPVSSQPNGHSNGAYVNDKETLQMSEYVNTKTIQNGCKTEASETGHDLEKTIHSKPKQDGKFKQLVKAFSLYSNLPLLLDTTERRGSLKALDAFRFFSMQWIVLGHVYSIGAVFMPETLANAKLAVMTLKDDWTFQGVYTGMLSVDTFFVLSGLLVSYLFLKASDKNKGRWCSQMIMYYLHRLIRLTPLYAILILVYAAFGRYLGEGPLFDWEVDRIRDCNNNWWANLLYINNFVKPREMCLGWSWYLSNDMQFYIVAPIMLIPLYMNAVIGAVIIGAFFIGHWASTAYLWSGTEGNSYLQDKDIFYEAYITPYCRIGPYLVGLLLGYVFYKEWKMTSRALVWLWWLISLFMMGLVVYIQFQDVRDFGTSKPSWGTVQRTLYETLSRDAWAVSVAWIIYACNHGHAGVIAHILNWKGWAPLGKLTYAAYLCHPLVIFIYVGNRRDLNYLNNITVAYSYSAYVLLSYLGGAILSLIFEWPAAGLERLLLSPFKKHS